MSKSTKIIAGLGVAAALGVAALPVASFAAQTTTNYTGAVGLSATIADELAIKIDNNNMATGGTAASGTAVTFMTNAIGTQGQDGYVAPSSNLIAGNFYKAGNTQILISTNVPNTYTLKARGTALTSADASIPVAGVVAAESTLPTENAANQSEYTGASMWGIKVSAIDKNNTAKALVTDAATPTPTNSVFNSAEKYMIDTSDTIVDYAEVTSGKINNTYSVEYGLGINAAQSSGIYTGTATYTVTHVKGTE